MVASISTRKSIKGAKDYFISASMEEGQVSEPEFLGKGLSEFGDEKLSFSELRFERLLKAENPNTGELLRNRNLSNHKPMWDITFSADKSVSIVHAFSGENHKQEILKAHQQAVNKAMGYYEKNLAFTRVGAGSKIMEKLNGNIWCRDDHYISRNFDPQLHSHNILFNIGKRIDGKWGAIHSKVIYENKKLLGTIYQAELAQSLERMGYELGQHKFGNAFYIKGIPLEVRKEFSSRREEILEAIEKYGYTTPAGYEKAALRTREPKKYISPDVLRKLWDDKAKKIGLTPKMIKALRHTANQSQVSVELFHILHQADPKSFARVSEITLPNDASLKLLPGIVKGGANALGRQAKTLINLIQPKEVKKIRKLGRRIAKLVQQPQAQDQSRRGEQSQQGPQQSDHQKITIKMGD